MLEPSFGRRSEDGKDVKTTALTLVTYLRRLTRSVTTLEGVGTAEDATVQRVKVVADRLEAVSKILSGSGSIANPAAVDLAISGSASSPQTSMAGNVAEQQIRRMERQAGVVERAAEAILREMV